MKQKMKAAIYIRVALENQLEADLQQEQLFRFAAEQGYPDPVCYVDNGFSGPCLDRPAFSEMEEAIRAGSIHTIMVRDIARIGRNVLEVERWLGDLTSKGVRLVAEDGSHECVSMDADIRAAFERYLRKQRKNKKTG